MRFMTVQHAACNVQYAAWGVCRSYFKGIRSMLDAVQQSLNMLINVPPLPCFPARPFLQPSDASITRRWGMRCMRYVDFARDGPSPGAGVARDGPGRVGYITLQSNGGDSSSFLCSPVASRHHGCRWHSLAPIPYY
jgi:hypothetical protein